MLTVDDLQAIALEGFAGASACAQLLPLASQAG